jgi:hypothetical protein
LDDPLNAYVPTLKHRVQDGDRFRIQPFPCPGIDDAKGVERIVCGLIGRFVVAASKVAATAIIRARNPSTLRSVG